MTSQLTPFWESWLRSKVSEFRAQGACKKVAKKAALFELRSRQKIANLIGDKAAATHEISVELYADGRYRTVLTIPPSAIPEELRPRATAWATSPQATIQ